MLIIAWLTPFFLVPLFLRYDANLVHASKAGIKRGMISGVTVGLTWFIIYAAYALAFWYGSGLILESRPPNGTGEYDPAALIIVSDRASPLLHSSTYKGRLT